MIELTPEQHLRNDLAYFLSQLPSPCTPQVIGDLVADWLAQRNVTILAGAKLTIAERAKKAQSRTILADDIVNIFSGGLSNLRLDVQ